MTNAGEWPPARRPTSTAWVLSWPGCCRAKTIESDRQRLRQGPRRRLVPGRPGPRPARRRSIRAADRARSSGAARRAPRPDGRHGQLDDAGREPRAIRACSRGQPEPNRWSIPSEREHSSSTRAYPAWADIACWRSWAREPRGSSTARRIRPTAPSSRSRSCGRTGSTIPMSSGGFARRPGSWPRPTILTSSTCSNSTRTTASRTWSSNSWPARASGNLLAERGRLGEKEALSFMAAVARGLMEAHERGIVHRDIKPSNILLLEPHRPAAGTTYRRSRFVRACEDDHESGLHSQREFEGR